jgi:hypothetical protein
VRIIWCTIAALTIAAASGCGGAGTESAQWRTAPASASEWRVYQDVRERRRLEIRGSEPAGLEFRLLRAPRFVALSRGGTLEVAGSAMAVGLHRIVVEVRGPQRSERIEISLRVMPVV